MNQLWMKAMLALSLLAPAMGVSQAPAPPAGSTPSAASPAVAGAGTQSTAQPAEAPEEAERNERRGRRTSVTIQMSEEDAERLREAIQDPELKKKIEQHIDRIGGQINPRDWRGVGALAMLVPLSFMAVVALAAWLIYRRVQERMKSRMEMHAALLAKFSTGAEFTEFVSSPGGKEYIERLTAGPERHHNGSLRRSVWIGYVFTAMGGGMLLVRLIQGGSLMGGVVLLAIGLGHLLALRAAKQQEERIAPPTLPGGPPSATS